MTTWGEAEQFLNQFALPAYSLYEVEVVRPGTDYSVTITFSVNEKGIVTSMDVDPSLVDIYPLHKILKLLGKPRMVLIKATAGSQFTDSEIDLLYEGVKTRYEFSGDLPNDSENIKLCETTPGFSPATFSIPGEEINLSGFVPLETVSSMTIDTFYNNFLYNGQDCILVSKDIVK